MSIMNEQVVDYQLAKQQFIKNWGEFGLNWGVNRILAQIHGLLLISCEAKCADEVMQELNISRGSTNTNLRILCEWKLVHIQHVTDTRKEFFVAEKDMWKVFCQIVKHRRKKELDPLMEALQTLSAIEGNCERSKEFKKMVSSIETFSKKADKALENIVKESPSFLVSSYMKIM